MDSVRHTNRTTTALFSWLFVSLTQPFFSESTGSKSRKLRDPITDVSSKLTNSDFGGKYLTAI